MEYITLAVSGVPNTRHGDKLKMAKIEMTHMWAKLHHRCHLGGTNAKHRDKITNGFLTCAIMGAHMWAKWLYHACRLAGRQLSAEGGNQKRLSQSYRHGGLHVGKVATQPLPS